MPTATLAGAEVRTLAQEDVDKYVRRDSRLKLLTKAHEVQKGELKTMFLDGARCPLGGPFVLGITEQTRTDFDWKGECLLLLQEMYGEDEGTKKLEGIEAQAPKKKIHQLAIKRNLRFNR